MKLWIVALALPLSACRPHPVITAPTEPTRWILDPDASDADLFCVPTDVHLPCLTVGTIRAYVRDMRSAE